MNKAIVVTLLVLVCIIQSVFADGVDPQIYGGEYANEGQFPFMVQLVRKSDQSFFCGGSLIGSYHILTAAHCTDGMTASQLQIWTGSVNLYSSSGKFIDVTAIYQHADYNDNTIKNDITVIKLKSPFPSSLKAKAIALASSNVAVGTTVTVAGWGKTEDYYYPYPYLMLYTTAPVLSTSQCNSFGYDVDGSQICAHRAGYDSCQGDSGGPLFTGSAGAATQHGIVSYGDGCGENPGVYTRVYHYRSWINSRTKHNVAVPCSGCAQNNQFKNMCEGINGVYLLTANNHQCRELTVLKTRQINFTWNGCTNTILKTFCDRIGRYTCSNNQGKCTRL